jgi:transcriptional regulator with XRE-family HTH domain
VDDIVGLNIRRIRQSKGLLQKELAFDAEMDPSSLSKLERGDYTWTKANLSRLGDALGVPVSAFFADEGRPVAEPIRVADGAPDRTLRRILVILEKWDSAGVGRCA